MNNEPVAWISVLGIDLIGQKFTDVRVSLTKTDVASIPLYTHPVKEQDTDCQYCKQGCIRCDARKQLTDEEIKFIAYPFESVYTTYDKQTDTDTVHTRFDQLGFARAILRKAQEK